VADGRGIHLPVSEAQVRSGASVLVPGSVTPDAPPATHETDPPL